MKKSIALLYSVACGLYGAFFFERGSREAKLGVDSCRYIRTSGGVGPLTTICDNHGQMHFTVTVVHLTPFFVIHLAACSLFALSHIQLSVPAAVLTLSRPLKRKYTVTSLSTIGYYSSSDTNKRCRPIVSAVSACYYRLHNAVKRDMHLLCYENPGCLCLCWPQPGVRPSFLMIRAQLKKAPFPPHRRSDNYPQTSYYIRGHRARPWMHPAPCAVDRRQ